MVLKSYRLKGTFKKEARKVKPFGNSKDIGRIVTGGITALIGVALLTQVAGAISKL